MGSLLKYVCETCGREMPNDKAAKWHREHEHIAVRENAEIESLRQQLDEVRVAETRENTEAVCLRALARRLAEALRLNMTHLKGYTNSLAIDGPAGEVKRVAYNDMQFAKDALDDARKMGVIE